MTLIISFSVPEVVQTVAAVIGAASGVGCVIFAYLSYKK